MCLSVCLSLFAAQSNGRIFAVGRCSAVRLLLSFFDGSRDSVAIFSAIGAGQLKVQILVAAFERTFFAFLLLDDLAGVLLVNARL